MSLTDPVADLLTRIRNAQQAQKKWVDIPSSNLIIRITYVLKEEAFIRDYILWITQEYIGIQKLDKEIRSIFWRLIPFPESTKKDLKTRGFVYSELYKKDLNRGRSDGY